MNLPKKIWNKIQGKICVRDAIGMSGAGVYLYDDYVLKVQPISDQSENETAMLQWLNGKIPVPNIIEHINENEYSYILMNKCTGKMACDPYYMVQPKHQIELLAEALHMLWEVDVTDCPCQWTIQKHLALAEENVIHNRVDMDDAEPGTFGPNGFLNPDALLYWLQDNRPQENAALCHGDFCLPNIFLLDNKVTGLIDLGRAGVADQWLDIALCCRSLEHNYDGIYDGKSYPGYNSQMLFDALDIQRDEERIRYYILLDELL